MAPSSPPPSPASSSGSPIDDFLRPLRIDSDKCHLLSRGFLDNFAHLAAHSSEQFLPTPISDSILGPVSDHGHGRHLAIDIGGTNLRVGFVELLLDQDQHQSGHVGCLPRQPDPPSAGRVRRHLEKSWPISNHLKNDNADSLFLWIGTCIAEVVQDGCSTFGLPPDEPLPLGVAFSFPTDQHSLAEATITSMGKGFAIPPDVELGARLRQGYDQVKSTGLPPIRVVAVANDSVSTLVSFMFNYGRKAHRRATMGLILGTGSNATVPLRLSQLHASKRRQEVSLCPGQELLDNVRIAVNTEWSINGTEPPMRQLGLITPWDDTLSAQNERPGFQPLEYMTAGRYLGELGRIMLLDYVTSRLGISRHSLPPKLLQRHTLTTTFLSHFKPLQPLVLVSKLEQEFPPPPPFPASDGDPAFVWTEGLAEALYRIAKAIEQRAAGIMASAIIALLTLAGEIPEEGSATAAPADELGVGYTGGCIVHFQEYLADCQAILDDLVRRREGPEPPFRVALRPCHDGGITGAGILAAAALMSQQKWAEHGAQEASGRSQRDASLAA